MRECFAEGPTTCRSRNNILYRPTFAVCTTGLALVWLTELFSVLDRIARKLSERSRRGRFKKLVLKSRDAASLKDLGEQLEQCATMMSVWSYVSSTVFYLNFRTQLHLQMDSLRLSASLDASVQLRESAVAQAIAKAQKEEMDLIKSHFMTKVGVQSPWYIWVVVEHAIATVEARHRQKVSIWWYSILSLNFFKPQSSPSSTPHLPWTLSRDAKYSSHIIERGSNLRLHSWNRRGWQNQFRSGRSPSSQDNSMLSLLPLLRPLWLVDRCIFCIDCFSKPVQCCREGILDSVSTAMSESRRKDSAHVGQLRNSMGGHIF